MPQMGFGMQEGTVVRWLKAEGSKIRMGEPVAEVETDKAVVEFESYASGVLYKILVQEGTTVPVGQPIALVGVEGEAPIEIQESAPPPVAPAPPIITPPVAAPAALEEPVDTPTPGKVRASPVARKLAEEHGIDLSQIEGTGPGGRITKGDVLAYNSRRPRAPAEVEVPRPKATHTPAEAAAGERVPLSRMRQQIARVTIRSKQEKPHFYLSAEVDMTRAMELREQLNQALEHDGVRVTVNDLIIKACVEALKKYPKFNAFFVEEGVQMNVQINIGVAIAEEEGLIVPAIMNCANKSLTDIAVASKDLSERAKSGTLSPKEYTGGTLTISNLGMFDVTSFAAIIHPPQTAVLAVGTVTKRPVVRDDQIRIAQMMTATLSADHRIVDGAEGARFLVEVKRLLENPLGFLL